VSGLADVSRSLLLALPPLAVAAYGEVGTAAVHPGRAVRARRAAWVTACTASLVVLLAYDPYSDAGCRRTCLPIDAPLADLLPARSVLGLVALLVVLGAACAGAATFRAGDGLLVPAVLGALVLVLAPQLQVLVQDAGNRPEWPDVLPALALLPPSFVLLFRDITVRRRRRATQRLLADLVTAAQPPLEFWDDTGRRWVDADGVASARSADEQPRPVVVRDARGDLARWWDPSTGSGEVDDAWDAGTMLALDNARLSAVARARLRDLRASQRQIVVTGDAERRRLERELHDRTQQRLVAASLHLRLAAGRTEDPALARSLVDAEGLLRGPLAVLRDLSRGPFPELLSDEGLVAACEELARDPARRIALDGAEVSSRFADDVERATYFLVADATSLGAACALRTDDGELVVRVIAAEALDLAAALDRVGAAGGNVAVEEPAHTIRVVFPGSAVPIPDGA
jgi:signal transduction histidine kinase